MQDNGGQFKSTFWLPRLHQAPEISYDTEEVPVCIANKTHYGGKVSVYITIILSTENERRVVLFWMLINLLGKQLQK